MSAAAGTAVAVLRRRIAKRLAESGVGDTPDLDARMLVGHLLGCDAAAVVLRDRDPVSDALVEKADRLADLRLAGWPVARIVGQKEFWGLSLALNPETLVPRPDTETVVEAVLSRLDRVAGRESALSVLDLGTGSGAILLALIGELPLAFGVGGDRSEAAVSAARTNAERNGFEDRVAFFTGDWGTALKGRFDLIVSNPPYIRSGEIAGLPLEVREHDPYLALDGGPDGLAAYRRVIGDVSRLLKPDGMAALEVGHDQASEVSRLANAAGYATDIVTDLAGRERVVVLSDDQK